MVRSSALLLLLASPVAVSAQNALPSAEPIREFMKAIPKLREVPYRLVPIQPIGFYVGNEEQYPFHYQRRQVVAYSFIAGKERGAVIGVKALAGFTAECTAKGGRLEPTTSEPQVATARSMFPLGQYDERWFAGGPDARMILLICTATPARSLGALSVTKDRTAKRTAIVLFSPDAVTTQVALNAAAIAAELKQARAAQMEQREIERVSQWRKALTSGTETACGPVLSTSGSMVEVAHHPLRQPRWYRRGELVPVRRADGHLNSCG